MATVTINYSKAHGQKAQPQASTHRKKPSKKTSGSVAKTTSLTNCDIFADNCLVESPRRITREKTTVGLHSDLSDALEEFYHSVVAIPDHILAAAISSCKELVSYILPKISKLAISSGLKIQGVRYAGSTFDDSHVINPAQMDVFIMFDRQKTKAESTESGYFVLPLKRHKDDPGEPPDPFRYGRSDDSLHLSSMTVARLTHGLVERTLRVHPHAKVLPFVMAQNSAQIIIQHDDGYQVNLIPATSVHEEGMYLITRPYAHDEYPASHLLWRASFAEKERQILSSIDSADRGVRRKAFRLLKALIQVEPSLHGLTSYHIKTTLLHSCDSAIDHTPRWQRDSVEVAFMDLLSQLHDHLATRSLPHFFLRGCNLLGNMEARRVAALRARVGYLLYNHSEVARIIKKRTHPRAS